MDIMDYIKASEAVEIGLKSGFVMYGRFAGVSGPYLVLSDPQGDKVLVPIAETNIAYIKLVGADPEIKATMDKQEEPQIQQQVHQKPIVLDRIPPSRQAAIEAIKEKFRHNTDFATSPSRAGFRPTVQFDLGDKK